MGSSDRHKVCFELLGVPVIIRALETYNLCGSMLNVVVVGMMAESVMSTVSRRFPSTAYAFQDQPRGTGDAARKGAEILERLQFEQDVLVVAGDKVIDPRALKKLLQAHWQSGADVTLATARRPVNSSGGILLMSRQGRLLGILEETERRRLAALEAINQALARKRLLTAGQLACIVDEHCSLKSAPALIAELSPATDAAGRLDRRRFESLVPKEVRLGRLRVGAETVPVGKILERFTQMNLSTYVFRAPVLYDALGRLKPSRTGGEEYLTDIFGILAQGAKPANVMGCEVEDRRDVMAFNNPQELLAIEEVYRQKQGRTIAQAPGEAADKVAPASQWLQMLESPSAAARRQLWNCYGDDIPWSRLRQAIEAFIQRFGPERPAVFVRSPGRINLMGRHIDHQGGTVNVMAVNREVILVAAPRADDLVTLANSDGARFSEETFRISDLVASLNWDDWQRVIDGPRLQRLLEAARGDWANYFKAALLRLQEQFRDRQLHGLDLMVSGDIPIGAGLSSSSALVVAAAEAARLFNRLPVSAQRLVSLCGEGEWFVGTRGGAADHAAILLARRGYVTRVGFLPFEVQASARFFPDCDLVACDSGLYAGKSQKARNTFNAKVTAYHIGRIWFKMLRPDLAPAIEHLRDIEPEKLGLRRDEFLRLLSQLPAHITRSKVQAALSQMAENERDRLERMFLSHEAPEKGYEVRGVVMFGLAEIRRARLCLDLLKQNNPAALGRLMRISHDGDRVAWGRGVNRQARNAAANGQLELTPGAYGCSLPELDRIVDTALRLPGVEGAQLAGAGLGGCIMALVRKAETGNVLRALADQDIKAHLFRPIAGACALSLA
jgi:N-acetylgalactosamine kinase